MNAYHNRRKYRLRVAYFLLTAVILPVSCTGVVGICIAAENVCEKLLSQEAFRKFNKEKVETIQKNLVATGYDPKKIDGIIGPLTRDALKQFCVEFENEFRKDSIDDFIAKLFLYAAIANDFSKWKEIVLNEK